MFLRYNKSTQSFKPTNERAFKKKHLVLVQFTVQITNIIRGQKTLATQIKS